MMPRIYPATPPPRTFYPLLLLFHLFPLHAPVTLWILDAPFGRFAIPSRLNLDGNWAWAGMELVAVSEHERSECEQRSECEPA